MKINRGFKLLSAILIGIVFVSTLFALDFALFLRRPIAPPQPTEIEITSGSSFKSVARQLAAEKIISRPLYFKLLARHQQVQGAIQAGRYLFNQTARPAEVLARLVAGDVIRHPLTIPEGLTLKQIANRVEEQGFGSADRFMDLAREPRFLKMIDADISSLEGYLFPETYVLDKNIGEQRLLTAMITEFNKRARPEWRAAAAERGLSLHQWVTLASIIEKETALTEEMPRISGVFYNRLELGMRLQTDPTVIYGIEDFDGNLTRTHLRTPTPYNTYTNSGLPPGPICNPGADALHAAAYPASTQDLYFVSRGDGSHVFSRTLKEHNQAVRRYQLNRP
ncbi:MAG TPA: endolytic transglycosylase MltG [Geoalkalibacter subterraneus]|uniref:Endolytic murein transglycosylase n=1 Tax=Geoalkalibacter subterraneus TaxID=483547 RepID=A0A831LR09_9BACT|nr:endolytic transglycosylase MltG [Geoalkalibacter subterraneus]